MPESLDLNLLPLYRKDGREEPVLPGLYLSMPPRKATRSRADDRLILYFVMTGNSPLNPQQLEQILTRLAQTFYQTPGSVTSAIKKVAEQVNQYLLDRNLHASTSGKQAIGLLSVLVVRDARLTFGQCGPGHGFWMTSGGVEHFYDPQGAGRGLGLARSFGVRFYQTEIQNNDVLVLSAQPPAPWTPISLKGAPSQGLESLRRRLLTQSGMELNAVVIQAQSGTGKLRLLRTKTIQPMVQPLSEDRSAANAKPESPAQSLVPAVSNEPVVEEPSINLTLPEEEPEPELPMDFPAPLEAASRPVDLPPWEEAPSEPQPSETQPSQSPQASTQPAQTKADLSSGRLIRRPQSASSIQPSVSDLQTPSARVQPGETTQPAANEQAQPVRRLGAAMQPAVGRPTRRSQRDAQRANQGSARKPVRFPTGPVAQVLLIVGKALQTTYRAVARGLIFIIKGVLPDESLLTIPTSTMIFVALAVAVIFATVGGAVYVQRGKASQYIVYYEQAQQAAQFARQQTDTLEVRTAWETALDYLTKAEQYQKNRPESFALRSEAQTVLDSLDGITRLNFAPAITGGLGSSINITRMVASETDLYMLNANGGNVLRAVLTGTGYERDPNFVCGPNPTVGPLVDIVALPKGHNSKATILGLDGYGNLLYCIPDSPPSVKPPAPPHTNWGAPTGLSLDAGDLYILDPATNAVWIYWNSDTENAPHLFFAEQVPYMKDVIDLIVNNGDLFLLHADGHITKCVYSALQASPTRCEDPLPFSDPRPGRQGGTVILDAPFGQLVYAPPPDPSLYMLDPINRSIYHFSVRLNFQSQFRSINAFPDKAATSFAISPDRRVFMAIGNQVYYALLP